MDTNHKEDLVLSTPIGLRLGGLTIYTNPGYSHTVGSRIGVN